ncbi:hypothetical protein [Priestia megaterium]|uniref:hypothetical protein n=1 Tax=Priestia megaterium TaxID=1404 RepID=UPI003FD21292
MIRRSVAGFEIKRELIAYVKQSGIPSIIFQPTFYMGNFLIPGVVSNQTLDYFEKYDTVL